MATVDEQLQVADVPQVGRWRYVGGVERVYPHVPVTVQDGAVLEHAGVPAEDGCWEPADDAEVTHLPDNTSLSEIFDLDAYGHPAMGGESASGPATWPQVSPDNAPAGERQADDGEQQQFQLNENTGE